MKALSILLEHVTKIQQDSFVQFKSYQFQQPYFKMPKQPHQSLKHINSSHKKPQTISHHTPQKYISKSISKPHEQQPAFLLNKAYQTILTKLLRLNNLSDFVRECQKYVDLQQQIVKQFKNNLEKYRRSRSQLPLVGYTLMIDGGFLKHYSKLVQKFIEPLFLEEFRTNFYFKYRNKVQIRKSMFDQYFKKERKQEEQMKKFKSKSKSKNRVKQLNYSRKAQTQTKRSNKTFYNGNNQQNMIHLSNIDVISENQQSKISFHTTKLTTPQKHSERKSAFKSKKKTPIKIENQQQNYQFQMIKSPSIRKKKPRFEDQEQLQDTSQIKTGTKGKKSRRKAEIVLFQDEIKSNKSLKAEFQSLVKRNSQFQKSITIQKEISSEKDAIRRSSLKERLSIKDRPRLRQLKKREISKLDLSQRLLLQHFQDIEFIGSKQCVKINLIDENPLGTIGPHTIWRSVITDEFHYLEPTYHALILGKKNEGSMQQMKLDIGEAANIYQVLIIE